MGNLNPTQLHPAIAANLGYDVEAMNDDRKVTIVRRRVVYEELVVTKEEFEEINNKLQRTWEELDEKEFYLSELPMEDIQFPDFTENETMYIAFPGDVTSFTDDAIAFLYEDKEWTDSHEQIIIAS